MTKPRKCEICTTELSAWAWQPWGPGEDAICFTALGSHYRGFTVIKVCDDCKGKIEHGLPVMFRKFGHDIYFDNGECIAVEKTDAKDSHVISARRYEPRPRDPGV